MVMMALERGSPCRSRRLSARAAAAASKVDAIAEKDGQAALVSLKWQQTGGTAEQKVPFEVMCLADAVRPGGRRAYLVLGGDGWTLRDYYVSGAMAEHLIHAQLVRVSDAQAFVRLANNGQL
jgi:hypothetical protein